MNFFSTLTAVVIFYLNSLQYEGTLAIPVTTRTDVNPFDVGILDSCVVPTKEQLLNCSKFITHPVPASLLSATVLGIKHKRILGLAQRAMEVETTAGTASKAIPCSESVLEQQCRIEFPNCVDIPSVNSTSTDNKSVEFISSYSCMNDEICTYNEPNCVPNTTVPLASCTPVANLPDISYCNTLSGWSNIYITKWMHVQLQQVEQDIEEFYNSISNPKAREVCGPYYAELRCGTIGRCSEQGTRVEINATQEICNSLINCVSSSLKPGLLQIINCSQYPSESDKLPTPATPITPPTTQSTTTATKPTSSDKPTSSPTTLTDSTPDTISPVVPDRVTSGSIQLSSLSGLVSLISILLFTVCIVVTL